MFGCYALQRSLIQTIVAAQSILSNSHFLLRMKRGVKRLIHIHTADNASCHALLFTIEKLLLSWHRDNNGSLELDSRCFSPRMERLLTLASVEIRSASGAKALNGA